MGPSPSANRCLLLTPPGSAAIAVVRLVGPATDGFLKRHFSRHARHGRCVHGDLSDGDGNVIDDPVVVLSADGADVNLHGGSWVVRSVMELARAAGFEVIDQLPLPLPPAAVDHDSPVMIAILASLPLAKTELALRTLLDQELAWAELEAMPAAQRERELAAMREDRGLWWLLHPPRVAIAGAANVGKSTLANQLFGQERSITADLPGTTRDWVGETANLGGLAVTLVDTPGIRETADPIEAEAIGRAAGQLREADLVVLVLDASRPLAPEQSSLFARFPNAMVVINKADAAPAWELDSPDGIRTVATTGRGVDELRFAIRRHFQVDERPGKAKQFTGW